MPAIVALESEIALAPAAGEKVGAPQPEVEALGVPATCMAPGTTGRVSVKATPGRLSLGLGLTMVNVRWAVPFARIGLGAKYFVMTGGCSTVRAALADPPAPELSPDSVEEIKPLMLMCGPEVMPATLTLTVQLLLAEMLPPVKVRVVLPAPGLKVGVPHPVVLGAGVAATCRPAGSESVNWTPVTVTLLVLV